MTRLRPPRGFTLLEICIVIALAVVLMGLAVPSLTGQAKRRRLQESFDRLEELTARARQTAMTESKPFLLAWDKDGNVGLYPAELDLKARKKLGPLATLLSTKGTGRYTLFRPSALAAGAPSAEWTFWPSGTCEPVIVEFASAGNGNWKASFNALSARGTFTQFIAQ